MNPEVRILVVDDDPDILSGTARLLEQAGYAVDRAASGEEALQLVHQHHPFLLLLDRDLPDMEGLEVCRRIKRESAFADILVVMASASYADSEDQAAGLEGGADGYIARPIANRELLARVQSYLRIQELGRRLRVQNEDLSRRNVEASQAQLASLNLMEDAVAARREAEELLESLRGSEASLATTAALLESTGLIARVGGWELDLPSNRLYWSRETYRLHEVDPATMEPDVAKAISFYAEEARPIIQSAVQAAIDHGTSFDLDVPFITATGRRLWVQAQGSAEVKDGKTVKLVGAFHDITARRQAEEALKASERRYRDQFDFASEGIFTLSLEGDLLEVNESFARMHGYRTEEMQGMHLKDLDAPETAEKAPERMRRLLAGESLRFEVEHYHKDGHTFPMAVSASLISTGPQPVILCFHNDITERKKAEALIKASLLEKEALLKEVHHRVKNNLQVITSLLRLESARSAQSETRSVLEEMRGRIRSMAMLHEALYHTGTVAGVDLGEYLAQLAREAFAAHNTSPSSVQLRLDLGSVHAEMDQALPCGLIVNELLANALEHGFPSGRRGEVLVELHTEDEGHRLRLRVSDTGVGLPADFATRRHDSLGLQLIGDLAGQLGGTLDIGPGPAAVFTVTCPTGRR